MNRREWRWIGAAVLLSVLVHVGVAWPLWNVSLGGGSGRNLFASANRSDQQPIRVERATRDEIVSNDAGELAVEMKRGRMKMDVRKMVGPPKVEGQRPRRGEQVGLAKRRAVVGGLPVGDRGLLGVDLAVGDLGRADAGVTLPEYVGVSDGAKVAKPSDEPIRAAEQVRVGGDRSAGHGMGGGGLGSEGEDMLAGVGGRKGAGGVGGLGARDGQGGVKSIPMPVVQPQLPTDRQLPGQKVEEHLDEDFEYVLSKYEGPGKVERGGLWGGGGTSEKNFRGFRGFRGFELEIRPRESLKRLKALGKDVVYVIDTSGSIGAQWLHSVKVGVGAAMNALNQGDRFNVVMFAEKVRVFGAAGMVDATDANEAKARRFIAGSASAGYTDVSQALGKLVRRSMPNDRVYQIIFVSDGQPTAGSVSPRQIIDAFTRENNLTAAIYVVAVGDDENQELLGALAYRNKGYVVSGINSIRCGDVIRDLASRLRYPILKDVTFSEAGVDATQIYPQQPRDVYQNDPVVLYGRYKREDQKLSMRMVGTNGGKRMDFSFTKKISEAKTGNISIARNWARRKMHHLTAKLLRETVGDAAAIKQEIETLKRNYGLQ